MYGLANVLSARCPARCHFLFLQWFISTIIHMDKSVYRSISTAEYASSGFYILPCDYYSLL